MNNTSITEISISSPILKQFARAYKYAIEKTQSELNQAVEGMYHNLNTLNGALA